MNEAALKTLHPVIQDWIRRGLPVRTDASDAYAGRCGAPVVRRSGQAYCRTGAGKGTEHLGMGRCRQHEGVEEGLGLWIGQMDPVAWRRVAGGTDAGQAGTHGASVLAGEAMNRTLDDLFESLLDEDEAAWYRAVPSDPVKLIDFVVRTRVVALGRINRHLQQLRLDYAATGQRPPIEKTIGPEALADRISQTIARLQESRAKYEETKGKNDHLAGVRDLLRGLSDEEFNQIKSSPELLAGLVGSPSL